jgi:hypothetical protein
MSKICTLFGFLILCASAFSQTAGTVKGKLIDSLNKQSLKDATVTLLDARDSTLEVFGLAREDGSFSISNISFGDMLLQVKFQGYEPLSKKLTFSKANATIDLGILYLRQAATDLGNVTVTQSVIQMKKDTIEFNASSFKTKPNAVAEDLLKKMPGMEVSKDGTIKSQGELVQRVLVNGKRFFGDDPKMATKNLPPDVIDKIQVFDDQSDQSKFTGFDDGNRVKTINITTKKEMRKGIFGKAVAGVGTGGNYEESFNFSKMNGDQQFTLTGQANNINKQNFTQRNIGGGRAGGGGGFGGFGGFGGGGAGGSSGITTTWAAGFNYRDAWSKNIDAYGSYSFNSPQVVTDQISSIQNLLSKDSSTYNNSTSVSNSKNTNHNFSFNLEDRIDSNNSLIFRPNISFQNSTPNSVSSNITTGGKNNTLINQSVSRSSGYNSGFNVNGTNLQLRHRFAKKARTISLDLGFSASETNGSGNNYSVNTFYKPFLKTDTINQRYMDSSRSVTVNPTVSYTEPIGKNQMLELRYSYSYNNSTTINNTYRFDNVGQKFTMFDSLFSNSYKYTATSNTANLSYRIQEAKFNLNIGTGVQFTDLLSNNTTKNVIVSRNFVNLTPTMNFTYNYTKTKALRIFYNGRTSQPSTGQLQPILTTSDSINFQRGNPDLKPQFTNNLRILFTSFDPFTSKLILATINASVISNDIQNSIIQNPNGGKTTTYINLGGTYNLSGYFNYSFPLKRPKSNLNLQTNIDYRQNQSLLNNVSNYARSTTLTETIKWTTNLKNNFDMNLSTSFSYNPVRNTLSTQNTNYTTQSLAADFTVYSNNGWILASDFDYTHYGNRAPGYNTTVFLITPSIAKQFLKNKAGEFRLSCFDVLKQNVAVSSSVNGNQFINTKSNNLTRYFMLTFTYNLRNFAGQQQRGGQNQMMRGMFPGGDGMRPPGSGGGVHRGNN